MSTSLSGCCIGALARCIVVLSGISLFAITTSSVAAQESRPSSFGISAPGLVLDGIEFKLEITALAADGSVDTTYAGSPEVTGVMARDAKGVIPVRPVFERGRSAHTNIVVDGTGAIEIKVSDGEVHTVAQTRSIPGILSILPPLVAVLLALTIRQVVLALFSGIWVGAVFIFGYDPLVGLARVADHFIVNALADPDHASIIIFSLLFGGMVGIISKNGGTAGIAGVLVRMARSPRRGQFATWLLGLVVFFDDYANSLIVGNTMRPVTDKLRISREKLAYIVDSTAAPVSSILLVSTWIGYEVGLIDAAIKSIDYHMENAYWVFVHSIPYCFYPILSLAMVLLVSWTGRDFGPMLRAERRARHQKKLYRDGAQLATDLTESTTVSIEDGTPLRWYNGGIPVATVLIVGVLGLYLTGYNSIKEAGGTDFSIGTIIGKANSYQALMWAALASCAVAIILSVSQRILTLVKALDAWFVGIKSMLLAMIILILAWAIGAITRDLHTADYLVQLLRGTVAPHFVPVLTFLTSAVISFSTGTSWGTMGIVMPLVIPLSHALSIDAGLPAEQVHVLMIGTISGVLAGSVFGDHCSPISDTTILSSMASACDHIDHVRTQLPYALLVGVTGMLIGDIPSAYGLSPFVSIIIGIGVLVGVLFWLGKKSDEAESK
jgi:Na+/H+ antiporter NhaC